jgi:aspartyl-tRNA(Asn)/glutamyl-tRNA(Gln) amidotransferase subunit C
MITREDVEHVAELARLELTAAEKEQFIAQLNNILTYFEKLNELDTTDVEPTSQVIPMSKCHGLLKNSHDHGPACPHDS